MKPEIEKRKIVFLQNKLLKWFENNGRNFSWRRSKLTSYQLIIAEVLLQRTKAETVQNVYDNFITKYPNWASINETKSRTLEKSLMPLGLYKQRTARLKKLAYEMVLRNSKLPKTKNEIEKLPFAGQYITNAILLFVKKKPAPLLDVNMARVLERFFGPRKLADIRYDPYLQDLAWTVVNHKESKKINWAILDFAAIVCKVNNPICESCFLKTDCKYFNSR